MVEKCKPFRQQDAYEDTGDQDLYFAYPYDDIRSQRWISKQRQAIRSGDRAWAKGEIVDRDADTYLLEYPHLPDHPGIEMPIPSTNHDGPWIPDRMPLLDPMEALIGPFRWGKVARSIAALLYTDGHQGRCVIKGHNVGDALAKMIAEREGDDPYPHVEDGEDGEAALARRKRKIYSRWKTLMTAMNQMADYGYVWMFEHADDPSQTLIEGTPLLLTDLPDLLKKYRAEFFKQDHLGVPELGQSSNPSEGLLAEWPYIAKVNPDPRRVVDHSVAHYENRETTRWELPVLPEDRAPKQEVHLVARGIPVGNEYQIQSSWVEQMSAIQHVSLLHDYINAGTAVGMAIAELGSHIEATSIRDVTQGLLLLTPEDQLAVYDYVVNLLNPIRSEELRLLQFKGTTPVDLIHAAVEMVPTKGKKRVHVLRQIRLLVAALCQDLIGLWSGQVVEARPRPALHSSGAARHPVTQNK